MHDQSWIVGNINVFFGGGFGNMEVEEKIMGDRENSWSNTKERVGRNYYLTGTTGIRIQRGWKWAHYKCTWVHQLWIVIWSKQFMHTYWEGNYRHAWCKRYATDNESIEEVDNVQINDVVVDMVGFKNVESALVIFKQFFWTKTIDVAPLIQSIQTIKKEIGSWHAHMSHETTIDFFFHYI